MSAADVRGVIGHLFPRGGGLVGSRVYALLDGARDGRVTKLIRSKSESMDQACLYSGHLTPRMQAAAPYMVRLMPGERFTRDLLEQGWGRSWGVFTVVPIEVTFDQYRRHFRNLLRVRDETGRHLVFRYYDPRVLRVYLRTCNGDEARQFFGPVERIVTEGATPDRILSFVRSADGVEVAESSLAETGGTVASRGA